MGIFNKKERFNFYKRRFYNFLGLGYTYQLKNIDKIPSTFQNISYFEKKSYCYIPWIAGHTNLLIKQISSSLNDEIVALDFFDLSHNSNRKIINDFVREYPHIYYEYIFKQLSTVKANIKGIIFTFDWLPTMRIIAEVCKQLNIPTFLVPHEAIFLNEDKYYWDNITKASSPICDYVLCWGNLQKRIFSKRGYPESRIVIVGSPKLDECVNFKPSISKTEFCKKYGFSENVPIILFATQFLDIQINTKFAQDKQNEIISDLFEYCQNNNCQLLLRLPPNGKNILNKKVKQKIKNCSFARVDESNNYLSSPYESIYHCDLTVAINSTMLLESIIMGAKSLAIHYFDVKSLWSEKVIPIVKNKNELFGMISNLLESEFTVDDKDFSKIKHALSNGEFDGLSVQRIGKFLAQFINEKHSRYDIFNQFLNGDIIDVACIPSRITVYDTTQLYLKELLNVSTLYNYILVKEKLLSSVQLFFQWGLATTQNKILQNKLAKQLHKKIIYLEDGFIRSNNLGVLGSPTFSIIFDDMSCYYDATKETRLERFLTSDLSLSTNEKEYARSCIDLIVKNKVTKYNFTPKSSLSVGDNTRKKLLLVDQRYGDMSVKLGLGGENSFTQMLEDAFLYYKDYDIIIKQHPDSISGGKQSYLNSSVLEKYNHNKNFFIIDYDVNPYSLLEIVDEVFVCSSGMGFEALMAGKKVTCYGMPFYAGYGLTTDKINLTRRNKTRTLEDVFYYSYIKLSRYYDRELGKLVDLYSFIKLFCKESS